MPSLPQIEGWSFDFNKQTGKWSLQQTHGSLNELIRRLTVVNQPATNTIPATSNVVRRPVRQSISGAASVISNGSASPPGSPASAQSVLVADARAVSINQPSMPVAQNTTLEQRSLSSSSSPPPPYLQAQYAAPHRAPQQPAEVLAQHCPIELQNDPSRRTGRPVSATHQHQQIHIHHQHIQELQGTASGQPPSQQGMQNLYSGHMANSHHLSQASAGSAQYSGFHDPQDAPAELPATEAPIHASSAPAIVAPAPLPPVAQLNMQTPSPPPTTSSPLSQVMHQSSMTPPPLHSAYNMQANVRQISSPPQTVSPPFVQADLVARHAPVHTSTNMPWHPMADQASLQTSTNMPPAIPHGQYTMQNPLQGQPGSAPYAVTQAQSNIQPPYTQTMPTQPQNPVPPRYTPVHSTQQAFMNDPEQQMLEVGVAHLNITHNSSQAQSSQPVPVLVQPQVNANFNTGQSGTQNTQQQQSRPSVQYIYTSPDGSIASSSQVSFPPPPSSNTSQPVLTHTVSAPQVLQSTGVSSVKKGLASLGKWANKSGAAAGKWITENPTTASVVAAVVMDPSAGRDTRLAIQGYNQHKLQQQQKLQAQQNRINAASQAQQPHAGQSHAQAHRPSISAVPSGVSTSQAQNGGVQQPQQNTTYTHQGQQTLNMQGQSTSGQNTGEVPNQLYQIAGQLQAHHTQGQNQTNNQAKQFSHQMQVQDQQITNQQQQLALQQQQLQQQYLALQQQQQVNQQNNAAQQEYLNQQYMALQQQQQLNQFYAQQQLYTQQANQQSSDTDVFINSNTLDQVNQNNETTQVYIDQINPLVSMDTTLNQIPCTNTTSITVADTTTQDSGVTDTYIDTQTDVITDGSTTIFEQTTTEIDLNADGSMDAYVETDTDVYDT